MALFDWKFYLKYNPDLKIANILTETQAAGHYKLYGYFDRRWSNSSEQPTLGSCIRAKDVLTPSEYATKCSEESIAKSDFTIFESNLIKESSSNGSKNSVLPIKDQEKNSVFSIKDQEKNSVLSIKDQGKNSVLSIKDQGKNSVLSIKDQGNNSVLSIKDQGNNSVLSIKDQSKLLQERLKKFDWKFYLKSNPDLVAAGLKTKRDAVKHFWKFGFRENRLSNPVEALK